MSAVCQRLTELPKPAPLLPEVEQVQVEVRPPEPPKIYRDDEGNWHVAGEKMGELIAGLNVYDDDALRYFYRIIKIKGNRPAEAAGD